MLTVDSLGARLTTGKAAFSPTEQALSKHKISDQHTIRMLTAYRFTWSKLFMLDSASLS